jgi:biopolymer transport protein ExbD
VITRPLDLQSRLSAPPRDADVFFWLNVTVVALFFGLLGARFIQGTGEQVQLDGATQGFAVPQESTVTHAPASVVVSYRRDNMVLFEGGIFDLRDLQAPLEKYARLHPGSTLMARVDKAVSAQGLLDLCDLARKAGFAQVLLAAEQKPDDGESIRAVR